MTGLSTKDLAGRIDLALFSASATRQDVEQLCAQARRASIRGICVNGSRIELAYSLLEDSGVQLTALVGFPLGASDADAKRYETEIAVDQGAHAIEVPLNAGLLKDGDHKHVLRELRDIAEAADERPVTIVLQAHLLSAEEIELACHLALDSGAQFVCNGSDYDSPPVSVEVVRALRAAVGAKFGLKAAGGIRNAAMAAALVDAGATRIGILAGADFKKEFGG